MNPSRSENPVGRATARARLDAARHAWRSRSSDAPAAPKPPRAARVVGPLPLPSGSGRFTVEPDGTLLFADGSCAAFVRIDAFLNLWSLGPHDQARVCREFGVLVHGLAHAQGMQALIESTPTEADAVIAAVGAQITTDDQELRAVADGTLGWLDGEVRRAHVPALSGYILVSPALAVKGGLAGVVEEFRDQVGLRRTGPAAVDRHDLDAAVGDALAQVRAMDLAGTRLRRADVLALLWRCINPGAAQPADLAAACGPDALDGDLAAALMPRHWEERRREIAHTTADGVTTYTRSLYLLAAKDVTSPGYLGDLIALDCAARLSWHLRGLDNLRERTRVLRKRKASAASVRRAYEKHRLPSLDDEDALEEAGALAQGLHSADEGLALSTVVLTLQAPTVDDLDTATRRALSLIGTRLGIHPGKGRGYQKPLWQASLPLGQNMARRRAKRWHTAVIGNSLPFVSHNPGTATGMPLGFTTRGHELVLLDLLDPSLPNAVGIVAGRPGMGKTITLNRLGLWSLYAGRRVCFIDPAGHFGPLVELAGGELVAPGKQRAPKTVNLWDLPAGADLSEKVEHLVAAHEIMLTKRGEDLSPLHRALLDTAAQRVYADRGLVEGIAADDLRPLVGTDAPLEGELVAYLWRMADEEGRTLGEQEMLRQMHASLQQYVGRGRYARLVDRFTTANIEARALSFDLGELPDHVYDLLMFTVTTAMAGRAKSMYDATRGTSLEVLIADELWGMTERASAGHAIKDTALRSRHRGMAFLGATQQVSVLADNPVAKALLDAASLKCIYRLHDVRGGGDRSTVDYICDVLHAPAETAERLRGLRMGQMMMFRESKDGNVRHGEVDVMLPPLEKWMMTTEPWKDVPRRNEAVARLGSVAAAITELAGGEG